MLQSNSAGFERKQYKPPPEALELPSDLDCAVFPLTVHLISVGLAEPQKKAPPQGSTPVGRAVFPVIVQFTKVGLANEQ